ncbi:hypothetical protein T4B_1830, partial [Trichinella pseudospiralis]
LGILSNFSRIHRLRAIENLHPFKWNTVSCNYDRIISENAQLFEKNQM